MLESNEVFETVDLGTSHFTEANEAVRAALDRSDNVRLVDTEGQRYLGCAMCSGKKLEIHGTPGNDMACFMDGGTIEVFGNSQDQIGNTMNDGLIVVHGRCGDAAGYGMRGGSIYIRDDCGWRVGINMKQYEDKKPIIVIGGDAGSFLGEYMAGGVIVLLGKPERYLATGMHGGVIYLKNRIDSDSVAPGLMVEEVDEADKEFLNEVLSNYNHFFAGDTNEGAPVTGDGFYKLIPESSRPYASMYAS